MEGHGAVDTAVRTSAAVRPYVNMERKMIACRVVAVCASGVALLCLAASASVAGLGATRLQLLESFGTGPDPDAPDAGGPFGPRLQMNQSECYLLLAQAHQCRKLISPAQN